MRRWIFTLAVALVLVVLAGLFAQPSMAHDPDFTQNLDRSRCSFTTVGSNPYFPLWPGLVAHLEGEEEDEGETIPIAARNSVLHETIFIDGVLTRVVEEREWEDGELVEVSRNFFAECRETGDVWYFGEDVDDYEDGEIVGHGGQWRAGLDGATAGILVLGSPMVGARHYQEIAPEAQDRGEVIAVGVTLDVPAGTFEGVLQYEDSDALDPESVNDKFYAPGLGLIKDDELELKSLTAPSCMPGSENHCLGAGRFSVTSEWEDFDGNEGIGSPILASQDSGEFWFFDASNTELIVKVLNGCGENGFYWVFAAGLTNVGVELVVTDTQTSSMKTYENPVGTAYPPILDITAFPCN